MSDRLIVYYDGREVGELHQVSERDWSFVYSKAWRNGGFAISVTMPLQQDAYVREASTFFRNLLPEGPARTAICQQLGISIDNDFELLTRIGGDCAGALSIIFRGASRKAQQKRVRLDLETLAEKIDGVEGIIGKAVVRTRLSLAGAQEKVGVVPHNGVLFLPASDEPSTHILKVFSPRFAHLTLNEWLTMRLAKAFGLRVAAVELAATARGTFLVVERYDRRINGGKTRRLHQEDFCQALGYSPIHKYEQEGGPHFAACLALVRRHSRNALVDTQMLLRWLLFNIFSGNSDAHAKNLSLLYDERGIVLAPFYDVICTRVYEQLDKNLAMSVGDEREVERIGANAFRNAAKSWGLTSRYVRDEYERAISNFESAMTVVSDEADKSQVPHLDDALARNRQFWRKQLRWAKQVAGKWRS